jgi:16S rRNA (uracil1498-N3)-methyltransferase
MRKIRLLISQENIKINDQIEVFDNDFLYLTKVMRQKIGDKIFIFNGQNGEFQSEVISINKKFLCLKILKKIADLENSQNITLAFALVKNIKIDFIAQKATELGVSKFQPIITQHTIVDKINVDRFKISIKEACEQCERNDLPQILSLKKLDNFLSENSIKEKIIILCDESQKGKKAKELLPKILKNETDEIVVLVGPEGGFSSQEFKQMEKIENVFSMSLGKRILKVDTAIISALTLVQEFYSL